ncbi:MAG TPA: acyl-CoA dehydrogenase family protein [Vicinamibacterales bacterium]|jgi:alkylation response protein AidB-like acyl-CoA dehydrogenase|nr:acyl-CoA dehydrogenase family protein [Vicinamibacterales bacterium]
MTMTSPSVLTQDLLDRCRDRAPLYDRENRFCQEDFDDLKAAGYLRMAIPREFGGLGMTLAEVGRQTRRLAMYAPATALCINMHNYWVGTAADVWRSGDKSVEFILREAAAGEVFAAGHAEQGNETSLIMSITKAEKVPGGYKFTGRKSFGSLTPVWTRLGLHGMDLSDPTAPKVVHAFLRRDAGGFTIKETWDVMGMRATRSDDTILEGAFIPDDHIARVVPAGLAGADYFVLAIFAWALFGFSNIYYGLARRVVDLTIDHIKNKGSIALTRSMAWHPYAQFDVAEMVIALEAMLAQIEAMTGDWSSGVMHPDWPIKIVATKYNVVENAWKIVDRAMDTSGGFGMFKKSEMERLFRDARAGRFHPANSQLTHELIGKLALGLNPDETPRWG